MKKIMFLCMITVIFSSCVSNVQAKILTGKSDYYADNHIDIE